MPNPMALRHSAGGNRRYEIEVDRDLKKSTFLGASINDLDTVDGNSAHGVVGGGEDAFKYGGARRRVALQDVDEWEMAVDDRGWIEATKFDSVEELGDGDSSKDYEEPDNEGGASNQPVVDGDTRIPTTQKPDYPNVDETPGLGRVVRPAYSTGDIEVHIGRGRDIERLQTAFNLMPHYVIHDVRIYVHGRTRDGSTAHIPNVWLANEPHFILDGTDDGVVAGGGTNVGIFGKMDHIIQQNIKFEQISQCIWSRYVDVDFEGNGKAALSGKMGGKMCIDCDIGSDDDKYGIWSIGTEKIEVRNGRVRGWEAGIREAAFSGHALTGNPSFDADQKVKGGANEVWFAGEQVA